MCPALRDQADLAALKWGNMIQAARPAQAGLAARPRTLRLFADAASSRASLAELRSALGGTI